MLNVKIYHKQALKNVEKKVKRAQKRLHSVAKRELGRGAKRAAKEATQHVKAKTGIKLTRTEIRKKYIKATMATQGDIKKLQSQVSFARTSFGLVHFVAGKVRPTYGPVAKRRGPYVRIYKGKKTQIKRGFILKLKRGGLSPYRLFSRSAPGKSGYRALRSPTIPTLLRRTGMRLENLGNKTQKDIIEKIWARRGWIFD